jgi:hypothetical protein
MPATYEPIATSTMSSDATSITFTGISQSYTDLVVVAKMSGYYVAPTYIEMGIQVGNGSIDTGNNYNSALNYTDSPFSASRTNTNYVAWYGVGTPTNDTQRSTVIINLNDYSNTTTFKPVLLKVSSVQQLNSVNFTGYTIGCWGSTSAINQIRISNQNGTNLYSGTTVSLYGIKAA